MLEGVIRHDGDPVMAEQLAWTGINRFENGDVRRLRKLERSRPIDVSVALALAVWRISSGATRSKYEQEGVLVLSSGEAPTERGAWVDGEWVSA